MSKRASVLDIDVTYLAPPSAGGPSPPPPSLASSLLPPVSPAASYQPSRAVSFVTPPPSSHRFGAHLSPSNSNGTGYSSVSGTSSYATAQTNFGPSRSASAVSTTGGRGRRRRKMNNQEGNNGMENNNPHDQIRPKRSVLVMKHRLKSLQQHDDEDDAPPSPMPHRSPSSSSRSHQHHQGLSRQRTAGGTSILGSLRRSGSRMVAGWRGVPPPSEDPDSSGLLARDALAPGGAGLVDGLDQIPDPKPGRPSAASGEMIEMQSTARYTSVPFSQIDEEDDHSDQSQDHHSKSEDGATVHRRKTLTQRLHGDRPDRNLFPYRNTRDNLHAVQTFFRRFFLVLLIIPGWLIPYMLSKQIKYQVQLEKMAAEAEGRSPNPVPGMGAHGISLSKGVNLGVFILNMLAMMHLGKAVGACLEELVPKLGASIVSVLDAMTSSSVELSVAAFALMKGMVRVVQAAMLGAILNNLLLIMGLTIMVGGFYHHQQIITAETSQTGMNILMLATISFVIPVALDSTLMQIRTDALPKISLDTPSKLAEAMAAVQASVDHDILRLSKIMAVGMLGVYGCCLVYQYYGRIFIVLPEGKHEGEYTVHRRSTHYWFAGLAYVIMLGAQIYSAYLLVHAVEELGRQYELNDSFVGFILLPIVLVADLQEEVIAIKESRSNRLDRSIALMIGSCMQISLLVTPLLVLLGWILGEPMTFKFTIMETAIFTGSVLIVNYLIQDNETNWLEGSLLIAVFFMCAIAFYYDYVPFTPIAPGAAGGHGAAAGGGGGH